jgi:hypothetical protein
MDLLTVSALAYAILVSAFCTISFAAYWLVNKNGRRLFAAVASGFMATVAGFHVLILAGIIEYPPGPVVVGGIVLLLVSLVGVVAVAIWRW